MNTRTTKTPIKCPRCVNKVDPNCPSCKGTGLVYVEDTVIDDGWPYIPYVPYNPFIYPVLPVKEPYIYPQITWVSDTIKFTPDIDRFDYNNISDTIKFNFPVTDVFYYING